MNVFLDSLCRFLEVPIAGIVVCMALALIAHAYQLALQRLPKNMRQEIQALAEVVVQAMEQKYCLDNVSGSLKKREAMENMTRIASRLHLRLDEAHASTAIESAVYGLNLYHRLKTTRPTDSGFPRTSTGFPLTLK